jgi:hypothetical protein
MEQRGSEAPIGAILAGIGGVVMAIGAVLNWATASIDVEALAAALGVDPSLLAGTAGETSKSFAGTSSSDGKIVLVCGIVAIVIAILAFTRRQIPKALAIVAIVAGLVGGGLALYDISTKGDIVAEAKDAAAPSLEAAGIDASVLDDVFDVSLGIGIWLSVVGGVVVLVAGLMLVTKKAGGQPAVEMGGGPAPYMPADSGFGTPPAAPTSPTTDAPPPPPAPEPSPPPSDPGTGTPAGGGDVPPPA